MKPDYINSQEEGQSFAQQPEGPGVEGTVKIIAASKAMKEILVLLKTISGTDSTVLICGESGTGKELIARYIHQNSSRSGSVFLPINCAALPPDLIESELFGYEKGAFTGASREGKAGLFEQAEHGTIFLDEIGEMPLSLQSKLLRVLENGEVKRIGGNQIHAVNVRVLAATNRDLQSMVRKKKFREDLYYRLNVIPVLLPPIRERRDDVFPLCQHYLQQLNLRYGKKKRFGQEVRTILERYYWPGNAREIKNVIERLFVMTHFDIISISDLPRTFFTDPEAEENIEEDDIDIRVLCQRPYREALRAFEQVYLVSMLRQCNGNVTQAARLMKISRSDLYYKLQSCFPKAAGTPI